MKRRTRVAAIALVCTAGLLATPLAATAASPVATKSVGTTVDFWDLINQGAWGGAHMNVSTNNKYDLEGNWWNDRASSLWVWNPVDKLHVFKWLGYQGTEKVFIYGTDNLSDYGMNDTISSYWLEY